LNRADRLNAWIAAHFGLVAVVMTAWFVLAAWHLIPQGLVTPNGHLVDPSTVDPNGYNVWAYKHLAYSDIYRLYAERGLWSHPIPYVQARIEYPVVTGLFMWAASYAPGANGDFIASAVGLWLAGLGALYALRRIVPLTYWWLAATPLLFVFSLLNWDVLGIAFLVVGLWMVKEQRWGAAGAALAIGTCAKLFPIVYLPFLIARLYRDRETKQLRTLVGWFVGICVVLNVPFAIAGYHNWTFFLSFNAARSGVGIIGLVGQNVKVEDTVIGAAVLIAMLVGIRAVWRGGTVERAAIITFVVFLLLNKVYSPQYTLWLFVMALLAEWPIWTLVLLTVAGLVDYYGTFATLYLTNASVEPSKASTWWADTVAPWVSGVRYFLVGLSAVGAAAMGSGSVAAVSTSRGASSVLAASKDTSENGAVVPGASELLE
jgi:uncharacterized membrane protein